MCGSCNGTWKPITGRILTRDLSELRTVKPSYEFLEYHYAHGEPANVGDYGVHFTGSHLRNDVWPEEENLLLLQFPHDFLSKRGGARGRSQLANVGIDSCEPPAVTGRGVSQRFSDVRMDPSAVTCL